MRTPSAVLYDRDIRHALWRYLRATLKPTSPTLVLNEFPLQCGAGVADVAVLNGELVGYEIKSDVDSTSRLQGQVLTYDFVCDRSFLVTTPRRATSMKRHIPEWWGVLLIQDDGCSVMIDREAQRNGRLETLAVLDLLRRPELARIAREYSLRGYSSDSKHQLRLRLGAQIAEDVLRHLVREALRGRGDWSPRQLSLENETIKLG